MGEKVATTGEKHNGGADNIEMVATEKKRRYSTTHTSGQVRRTIGKSG